ncbi:MAG: ExbD/TolR family protein [bacterium]
MRKPKRRLGVAIDMTPMVDVAFLLLIFFMTTTTFKPAEEVVIQLPVSHAKYKVPDTGVLILTIAQDATIYRQVGTHDPMMKVEAAEVANVIRAERMRDRTLRVIVRADKNCPYGTMEDMMNALQEARATRFVLMTEGEGGSSGPGEELPEEGAANGAGASGDVGALFGDSRAAGEVVIARAAAAGRTD